MVPLKVAAHPKVLPFEEVTKTESLSDLLSRGSCGWDRLTAGLNIYLKTYMYL